MCVTAETGGRAVGQRPAPAPRDERPRQDSNLRHRLRRAVLYPLSYEGKGDERSAPPVGPRIAFGGPDGAEFRFGPVEGCRVG